MGLEGESEGRMQVLPGRKDDRDDDRFEEAKLSLDAMRRLADHQLNRIDLVRSSTRQTFVYVAGLFTVAQTAAMAALTQTAVSDNESRFLLIAAGVACGLLLLLGVLTVFVDRLVKVDGVSPEDIVRQDDSADDRTHLAQLLFKLEKEATDARSSVLENRTKLLRSSTVTAVLTVLAVAVELVGSLMTRLS